MSLMSSIAGSEFLRGIPAQHVLELSQLARELHFPLGGVLFTEGLEHDEFHVIAKGHVRLEMLVPGRGRVPILTAGPGDVLAWSTLLHRKTMTATAIALDDVMTVSFRGKDLLDLCQKNHELGYFLMKQLAGALSHRLVATRIQLLDLFGNRSIPTIDHVSELK